ncbi:uncharacterized protein LOC134226496 [Armigeres subalbatus]|uniref:uncharacterized protein LOC134226496 n=1 Tax=Armigeres subalbatus TaxID=124917 RepID=UPI002ED5720C
MESQASAAPRFDEHKFCRLCMSGVYELRTLIPNKLGGPDMITKIHTLTEVTIVPSEEQYSRICIRCIKQLEELDLFRRRCKDSDDQIRKMRKQQQNDKASAPRNAVLEDRSEVATSKLYRSIFDRLQYCEDAMIPGEYRIMYGGNFYRSSSLRVWKCERYACHCLMVIKHDLCSFGFFGEHTHVLSDTTSVRKIIGMDRQVMAFLSNLQKRHSKQVPHPSKDRHDLNSNNTRQDQAASPVPAAKTVQTIQTPRVAQILGLNMYQHGNPTNIVPGSIIKIISPNSHTTILSAKCRARTVPLITASATTQPTNSNEKTLSSVLNQRPKEQVSTQNDSAFCEQQSSTPKSSEERDGESPAHTQVKVIPALKPIDVLRTERKLLVKKSDSTKHKPSDMKCKRTIRFADKIPRPDEPVEASTSTAHTLTTTEKHRKSRAELVDELFKQIHTTLKICKSKTHAESSHSNNAENKSGAGSPSSIRDDVEGTELPKSDSIDDSNAEATVPHDQPETYKIHTSTPKKRKAQSAEPTEKSKLFKA